MRSLLSRRLVSPTFPMHIDTHIHIHPEKVPDQASGARGEVKMRLKPSRKPGPRPIPRARSKSDETWGSFCPVRLTPDVHPWGSGPPITTSTAASSLVSPPLPREASIVIGLCRVHSPCPPPRSSPVRGRSGRSESNPRCKDLVAWTRHSHALKELSRPIEMGVHLASSYFLFPFYPAHPDR